MAEPTDRCPRCGGNFHCGLNDAGPCACTTVKLDDATLAALRSRYDGCLCVGCLAELAALSASGDARPRAPAPAP
jgi:Cysteine-rich CWC